MSTLGIRDVCALGALLALAACGDDVLTGIPAGDVAVDGAQEPRAEAASCEAGPVRMVKVRAGTFQMGSPTEEVGRLENETLHEVTLTHDLCVGVTEVTQGSFEEVTGTNPSADTTCGADCPVEQVSWHRAAEYANALSARHGLESCYRCIGGACEEAENPYTCGGYRLPTEAEWEYFARAGALTSFPNGEDLALGGDSQCLDLTAQDAAVRPDDVAAVCVSGQEQRARPVASLAANAWGLYDVSGNVWEWCHDAWSWEPTSEAVTDPVRRAVVVAEVGTQPAENVQPGINGAASPGANPRSVRGGSFRYYPGFARLAHRAGGPAETAYDDLGFRVVRTLPR